MAKVKVVLEVDIEALRKTRAEAIGEEDAKNESLSEAISQELGWVNQSGISVDSVEEQDEESELLKALNDSISNDEHGDDKEILNFLRNATEEQLDEQAHGYEFEVFPGETIEIIMWQPFDHFTLRMLAEHIGL
jgi:hypothetical protein